MHKPIDLGQKYDDLISQASSLADKDRVHYPDFHIPETEDTRLLEMPDEGEATIKFKVVSRHHSESNRNGKKERRCSLTIEVCKIDFEDKPKKKNGNGYGDGARQSFKDYFKDK
jgi:hypothetical protein